MEHDVSPRPFRLGARAHNPKGPAARWAASRPDRGGSRDRRFKSCPRNHVAANPCGSPHFSAQNAASPFGLPLLPAKSLAAPALFACKRAHDVPACYQLFADFPTFPQPGTGGARCPTCSFFSSLLPSDPYLTHTVFPWVWVKLWSGYHRIPAPGIFLMAPSAPAPRPSSWLPPAGRWW